MTGMPPTHRRSTQHVPGLAAAWAVLIGTGITSVTYNVVHATQGARLEVVLAFLLGLAPAFVAACLSHIAAVLDMHWSAKAIVTLIMTGGMVLSASATASVIAPAEPGWRGWLFGIILDGGALFALWAIMNSRRRKNQAATEVEEAREAAAQARSAEQEAVQRAVLAGEELASTKAVLGAELDSVKAELEAVRKAVPQDGPNKRPRKTAKPSRTAPDDDLALEAKALQLLATNLDMSGAELARKLGVTEGYGRKLRRRLTDPDRPASETQDRAAIPVQDRSQDRPVPPGEDRPQDRS